MAPSKPCSNRGPRKTGKGRRQSPLFFVAALLAGLSTSFPLGAAEGFFARAETLTYSEPVSIDTALKEWDGPFFGGDVQWSANWVEAGYRRDDWSIAGLYRRDFWVGFSPDTAELYYRVSQRLPLDPGRRYTMDIRAYSFSATGARGSWRHRPLPGLSLQWGLSLFNASDLLAGRLNGHARALAENDYAYLASVDYSYDRDRLFEREVDAPRGLGASLDLALSYRLGERTSVRAQVVDLLGVIRWKDAPYTQARAYSNRVGYDDDGYIIVEPAIRGYEGNYAVYSQRLEPRLHLQFETPIGETLNGNLQYRYLFGQSLFGLGVSAPWRQALLGAQFWPALASFGVDVRHRGMSLGIVLDKLRYRDVRTLWLSIGINTD